MLSHVCDTSTWDVKYKNIYKIEIFVNTSKLGNLRFLESNGTFVNPWAQLIVSGESFSWGQV